MSWLEQMEVEMLSQVNSIDEFHHNFSEICDALQYNREQVTQAYFEIWAIKIGIGVKSDSSVDF